MEKIDYQDPHPNWTEVIIVWEEIIDEPFYPIRDILKWLDEEPGGRYHLHGYKGIEGFAFRFEHPEDATYFKLKWL
jgi:hypothetical protein